MNFITIIKINTGYLLCSFSQMISIMDMNCVLFEVLHESVCII